MTDKHYTQVKGERIKGDSGPNYRIMCLPEGGSFRDSDSYDEYTASWLKINGFGFAAADFELGEYGKKIRVRQDVEGGSLLLDTE